MNNDPFGKLGGLGNRLKRPSGTREQIGVHRRLATIPRLQLGIPGFFLSRRLHGSKSGETYDLYAIITDKNATAGRHKKVGEFPATVTVEEIERYILLKKLAGEV